jgi:hypothetical protein
VVACFCQAIGNSGKKEKFMVIRDKEQLRQYTTEYRLWQGIPSIEVTKNGRIFSLIMNSDSSDEDTYNRNNCMINIFINKAHLFS